MFGWGEFGLVLLLALILLGPDNMVDMARKLGRLYGEYKVAKRRLELEIMYGINPPDEDILKRVEEIREKSIIESAKKGVGLEEPKGINNQANNIVKNREVEG
ncbi:Sec-independent protein secretion pathway component [Geoglobus ahangari]|uniref:Sec-independent protein secretion pathway component n=1 Tax=Geoglobus ahangari TaxID=113653 RepID=A0A0F7ICV2_9EURY|nr:twin-arginine translocase TatA/TatE family subunit [Geoglobus ahangari]AKG90709.1 Sec-independent protein secretion pathway component [Geoglobus ahangari]